MESAEGVVQKKINGKGERYAKAQIKNQEP